MLAVPVRADATAEGFDADVIVVGGGSAGTTAVRRLVDAGARVLLLEAGTTDHNPAIHDLNRMHELWDAPENWALETVPQAHASNRRLGWPRGKVLGGSSALNGTIFVRGPKEDYDTWAYLGNYGWGWDDVLPIFKRIESHSFGPSDLHGADGPLSVLADYEPDPVQASIIQAGQEIGLPLNPDYNSGVVDGIAPMQFCVLGGERHSAAQAFLAPIAEDPNLLILTEAHATRVLFEGDRAVGVEWRRGGRIERAHAAQIVLSGGTIGSTQLLMLSGIGPAAHLAQHGIETLVDLPGVGENLQDHHIVPLLYSATKEITISPVLPPVQTHLWARSRPGLLVPDLQPLFFSYPLYEPWMTGPPNGVTLQPGLVRPASRGTIRLSGPTIDDELLLDPNVLSAQEDIEALKYGVRLIEDLAKAPAMAEWGLEQLYPSPGSSANDAELVQYIRDTVITYHHQVGTCKMGTDEMAVVDPELRVYGVESLRVADASIMPLVTTGNTHAPSILIGERLSDLLIEAGAGATKAAAAA